MKERIANYIKDVRTRSEEEKKRAAMMWTVILTIIIVIVWAITFSISLVNSRAEEERLRAEALAQAQAAAKASTTSAIETKDSWAIQLAKLVADGADSISTGFWVVGSWLHK